MVSTASEVLPTMDKNQSRLPQVLQAIADLDDWFQTMRQAGGYGGPVAHWWRHSLLYAGPAFDWRYEGILTGYATLYRKTGEPVWMHRVRSTVSDLLEGQFRAKGFKASEFEANPGTLGTPHEAAAVSGLLNSLDCLDAELESRAISLAESILRNLVDNLWDPRVRGFNDRPGIRGRVPNKLATFAEALLKYYEVTRKPEYLDYARTCLDDVLKYQIKIGRYAGAVHQYGPNAGEGDGRLFPYYNARCIPALLLGSQIMGDARYEEAASDIATFLRLSLEDDRWPQIIYADSGMARWPSWIAGVGDILRAMWLVGENIWGSPALVRLLNAQLKSGGFPTAEGFANRGTARQEPSGIDWLDVLPVSGWNDKVLRLFAEMIPMQVKIPDSDTSDVEMKVGFYGMPGQFAESSTGLSLDVRGRTVVRWCKNEPWVQTQFRPPSL